MVREISVRELAPYLRVPVIKAAEVLRFIVLSTGRAGSGFVSATCTELGFPCGHEYFFNPWTAHLHLDEIKGINPGLVGDSAWPAVGWLDEFSEELPLFHLVRHPMKYVNSLTQPPGYWAGAGGPYVQFKKVAISELQQPGLSEEESSMIHWLRWNQMIEERVPESRRFQLETDVWKLFRAISEVMGDPKGQEEIEAAIKAGREIRENKHRAGGAIFQADDLRDFELFPEFAAKAEEYGYDINETIP
jgi:hypothetical protein